jgi:hypothetical protein
MDTGFANLLSLSERREILQLVARLASGRPFVAGAFVEDLDGDMLANYCNQATEIRALGGTPIVFQCSELVEQSPDRIVEVYRRIGASVDRFLGFELGENVRPFWSDLFDRHVPPLIGYSKPGGAQALLAFQGDGMGTACMQGPISVGFPYLHWQ